MRALGYANEALIKGLLNFFKKRMSLNRTKCVKRDLTLKGILQRSAPTAAKGKQAECVALKLVFGYGSGE